jgi:(E)-4-hydroxy-3-methylbut-2-enyl-diphosphate synthase
MQLADAGSEMVRVTVNTNLAAQQIPELRRILDAEGYSHLPIIGDFHFNGHILLSEFPEAAATLDKYRINPGNVGHDKNFEAIIKIAIENNKPVRIGANMGSIDQALLTQMMEENAQSPSPRSDEEIAIDTLVESAMSSAQRAEKLGMPQNKIIVGVKISDVQGVIKATKDLAARMNQNGQFYAIHLGLTEAGSGLQGLISSSAALAILLQEGIGDTIRISLTPEPGQPRSKEVEACKTLLQSLGYRNFKPKVTSCPGCGRTGSDFFQTLAKQLNDHINKKLPQWQKLHPNVVDLKIAVMGCVVNGPGESRHSDIAISLPGKMEKPVAPVYIKGEYTQSLQGKNIAEEFIELVEDYIKSNF